MKGLQTPELAEHARHFSEHRTIAAQLCAGLTVTQFNSRPGPERWSIAECLVHLNISARLFGDAILRAVDHARAAGVVGAGPFRYGPFSRWLLRAVEPGNHRRYKAPRKFVPPPTATYEVAPVLDEFRAAGDRWDECLHRADGLHLARVKVPSPAVPLIRFPLGAVFAIQAAHERRHLVQAQQVKAGREGEILTR
jgi:hypothetical protein